MKTTALSILALAAVPAAFAQQQQVVRPPIAVYWVSAATMSGMGAMGAGGAGGPGMADIMRMAAGGGSSSTRTLDLRLGSTQGTAETPRAAHEIPAGLRMGTALPLLTPPQAKPEPREGDLPQGMEQPKGRMLIFWGCSEKAGPGQPVIIDFAKVASGQRPPNLVSRSVSRPQGPSQVRSKTYGEWPNREDSKTVPADSSLRGDHAVKGNYSPAMAFAVDDAHDFLAPVQLASAAAGDARRVNWQRVPNAIGYFMTAIGSKQGTNDVVMWSSSETQEMGSALMDYLPPAEVARLIREKVVLAPERSDCAVSAEAMKAMDTPMLQFIAYGDEMNFVQPPRPKDPKVPWEQQWAAKVRIKSVASTMLADGMDGGGRERPARQPRGESTPPASQPATQPEAPRQSNPLEDGTRILRGIFGR